MSEIVTLLQEAESKVVKCSLRLKGFRGVFCNKKKPVSVFCFYLVPIPPGQTAKNAQKERLLRRPCRVGW